MGAGASAVPTNSHDRSMDKPTRAVATEQSLSMVGKLLRDAIETQKIIVSTTSEGGAIDEYNNTGVLWGDRLGL